MAEQRVNARRAVLQLDEARSDDERKQSSFLPGVHRLGETVTNRRNSMQVVDPDSQQAVPATGQFRSAHPDAAAPLRGPALAEAMPLMAMDMYEYAFALDYGAAAAKYINAFLATIDWAAMNQR